VGIQHIRKLLAHSCLSHHFSAIPQPIPVFLTTFPQYPPQNFSQNFFSINLTSQYCCVILLSITYTQHEEDYMNYDPVLAESVRKSLSEDLAREICSVQPMTGPTGLVFEFSYLDSWYKKIFRKYFWRVWYRKTFFCTVGIHLFKPSCWTRQTHCVYCNLKGG
jgi:hypothetical protein